MPIFGFFTGAELVNECVEGLAVHSIPDCLKVDMHNVRGIDRMKSFCGCGVMFISVCKTWIMFEWTIPLIIFQ